MLRTDLFKTVDRGDTRFIAVRDTRTQAHQSIDIKEMDLRHCRQGRLGVGYHFLLLVDGSIQLGRNLKTVGSHSRKYDANSVAIGVVGGVNKEGELANTRSPDQLLSLDELSAFLKTVYPQASVHDEPITASP